MGFQPSSRRCNYVSMTFGWNGGPGEWMAFAWLLTQYHESHVSAEPEWDDDVAFSSQFLMDDQALV